MAALRTSLVKRNHAWTGADVPWRLDMEGAPSAGASEADFPLRGPQAQRIANDKNIKNLRITVAISHAKLRKNG